MNASVEDYQQALEGFLRDVEGMGGDAVSVLLYGSMARGEVRPGQSDLLDAYLFLRPEVFEDRDRFLKALQSMLEACERLSESGLPFHPFSYLSMDELDFLPVRSFSIFPVEPFSKIVWGTDVLPQLQETETSRLLGRTYFYEVRSAVHFFLARYLHKRVLTDQDCRQIIPVLIGVRKNIWMACMALGRWPNDALPINELEEALPGIDTTILKKIEILQKQDETTADPDDVREMLNEVMGFVEDLHDRILATLNSDQSQLMID
jgi:hypothetical protein